MNIIEASLEFSRSFAFNKTSDLKAENEFMKIFESLPQTVKLLYFKIQNNFSESRKNINLVFKEVKDDFLFILK
jgi:hypothetical protein